MGVSKQELERAVDDALGEVKSRIGSEEMFKEQLAKEGLTEERLRGRYRKDLEAQLLARKLLEKEISSKVKVTDKDVEDFFKERKGEFPTKPPEVVLAQVVILPKIDSLVDNKARTRAQEILDSLNTGRHEFERLAVLYSEDPSAQNGGDVGIFKRGDFEEEFEKSAFGLEPGKFSELVKSRFGYHIIKLVEKRDDQAHVKHILIKTEPTDEAEQEARRLATEVRKKIESGEPFEAVAKEYSQDPETSGKGGLVGSYPVEGLAPVLKNAIKGLPEGGVTEVVPMEIGYHIFKIVAKTPEREYEYEEVKDQLRQLVIQEKSQNDYERWLAELKKKTFIDVRGL
jgi:peptidyl-prolyl cis-trans isomerase SurA